MKWLRLLLVLAAAAPAAAAAQNNCTHPSTTCTSARFLPGTTATAWNLLNLRATQRACFDWPTCSGTLAHDGSVFRVTDDWHPATSDTYSLGVAGSRWANVKLSGSVSTNVSSGTNAFAIETEGARLDVGPAASDYFTSSGGNIVAHSPAFYLGAGSVAVSSGTLVSPAGLNTPLNLRGRVDDGVGAVGLRLGAVNALTSGTDRSVVGFYRDAGSTKVAEIYTDGSYAGAGGFFSGNVSTTGLIVGGSDVISKSQVGATTVDWSSIAAGTCSENTASVTGIGPDDVVACTWPGTDPNLSLSCRTVTDGVVFRLCNVSESAIDPASATYRFRTFR